MIEPEWAIGLTERDYEYLIKRMWYDAEIIQDEDALRLRARLVACRDLAVKKRVFVGPTDKKLA